MDFPARSPIQDSSPSAKDSSMTTNVEEQQQLDKHQDPPQTHDPQSPKTLTLEIPNSDYPNPQDPQADDPNQDDPDEITPVSPTISDSQVPPVTTTPSNLRRGGGGGGGGRRKKRRVLPGKKKRLELLAGTLSPVPFVPAKTLDFSSHEVLLRRLGLWDFVHLQLDSNLRGDLIAQLIANFNYQSRSSYVNEFRIKVSRADLARALQLPVKRDKADNASEEESEESVSFISELVSTWFLLHEDAWMMPDEINNITKMIKDGNFEKVEWSTLIWTMVEKELAASNLGNCFYASHLQLLMKSQKDELFKEEPAQMDIDVKDDDEEEEEEEEDVKMGEKILGGSELEEHTIELSLGGLDNTVKDDDQKDLKEQLGNDDAMDIVESKEDEEQGKWLQNSMNGHFLQRCNLGEVGVEESQEETKQEEELEEEAAAEEGKECEDGDNEEKEEEDEEQEEEEMVFGISPRGDALDGPGSESLLAAIEASQNPFSSGNVNVTPSDFLTSRADVQKIPGGSSFFNSGNGSKREVEHIENDMPHNKRMRSDAHWDMKQASDIYMVMDQWQHLMGRTKMLFEAKEQACQEMNMQQQYLISELDQRANIVHQLQKARMDEQQKRQVENYRLERELYMMGNLLEGYRKALKETTKAFAEYRKKCPLPEEPLYKDTGSGGLVLSTAELEKQRLKQEEENRQTRLFIEKKVKGFETGWITKFEGYIDGVELLNKRLQNIEKEVNPLKELVAKGKVPEAEMPECAPSEE